MKFIQPKPGQSLDLFRMVAHSEGYTLSDPESAKKFIDKLGEEFTKAKSNPIMLHGFRTQAMFEYVATSLGKCAVVKTEDAGGLHTTEPNINIPDFRILLIDGEEFFVEVKNFYQSSPFEVFKIKKEYLDGLQRYANLFKKPIKLAIFWSKWNIWTLAGIDVIECNGSKCTLTFERAFKNNEMSVLGDYSIATTPPLKFRVITDPAHPRTVEEDGKVIFTIGGIELLCGDNQITASPEQNIALFLMLYGDWPSEGGETHIDGGELISFDIVSHPIEASPEQGFDTIGIMSGMISRRFNMLTTGEGEIERLSPQTDISDLGLRIPNDYQGEVLHLWRFIQKASME